MVPLTPTRPEVYVATTNTVIYNSYASLVENLNRINSLKIKDNTGKNVADLCDSTLVDAESLEIDGAFNPEHLGYIIRIFKDTYDSIFHLWATQNYKEFMEFIKKLCVCEEYVRQPDDIITYGSLVQ